MKTEVESPFNRICISYNRRGHNVLPLDKRLRRIPWGDGGQGTEYRGKDGYRFTGRGWGRNSVSGIAYGGQVYPANHPAEDAGLFHKGNCPACWIDNRCYLCKAWPSAVVVLNPVVKKELVWSGWGGLYLLHLLYDLIPFDIIMIKIPDVSYEITVSIGV